VLARQFFRHDFVNFPCIDVFLTDQFTKISMSARGVWPCPRPPRRG
jgi:hypothetical protein